MVEIELVFLHLTDVLLQNTHQRPQLALQRNTLRVMWGRFIPLACGNRKAKRPPTFLSVTMLS